MYTATTQFTDKKTFFSVYYNRYRVQCCALWLLRRNHNNIIISYSLVLSFLSSPDIVYYRHIIYVCSRNKVIYACIELKSNYTSIPTFNFYFSIVSTNFLFTFFVHSRVNSNSTYITNSIQLSRLRQRFNKMCSIRKKKLFFSLFLVSKIIIILCTHYSLFWYLPI